MGGPWTYENEPEGLGLSGTNPFDGPMLVRVSTSPHATHVRYRVKR